MLASFFAVCVAHAGRGCLSHEVNDKVDQSKQYKQLQQLMKTKNAQLKEARVRLARYETDDTPLAADD